MCVLLIHMKAVEIKHSINKMIQNNISSACNYKLLINSTERGIYEFYHDIKCY